MSLFSAVGGLSWTLGPFIAAFLSDRFIFPYFDYSTPFWFLAICMFIAFFLIYWKVSETRTGPTSKKLELHKVGTKLVTVFRIPSITVPFIASLITIFAWMMYQGFLAPYLIEKFHFSEEWEGYAYAISSLFWMLGGFLTAHFLKRMHATKLIMIPLVLSGASVFCYLFTFHSYLVWPILAIANLTQAMVTACFLEFLPALSLLRITEKSLDLGMQDLPLSQHLAPRSLRNLCPLSDQPTLSSSIAHHASNSPLLHRLVQKKAPNH